MTETEARDRPHQHYRDRFYESLMARAPDSVLDIGCGEGALLKRLAADGVEAEGIEIEPELIDQARSDGLAVRNAPAESLPFEDGSVDWVVSEFTAHHLADIERAVAEAKRVARRGVAMLDIWYDPLLAGHRLANRFDRWCKTIDRHRGMVHEPTFSVAETVELAQRLALAGMEIETMLIPVPFTADQMTRMARQQMAHGDVPPGCEEEWHGISKKVHRVEAIDDGALMLFASI